MDGPFVPNIPIGVPVVAALSRVTKLPLDVHLMISDPDRYLDAFAGAGAAVLTVHAEVLPHLHRTLTHIRHLGAKPGVAINPSTPVAMLADVIEELDHILVMSVNPGFGGRRSYRTASRRSRRGASSWPPPVILLPAKSTAASILKTRARSSKRARRFSSPARRSSRSPIRPRLSRRSDAPAAEGGRPCRPLPPTSACA